MAKTGLSPRESEVMTLKAQGLNRHEIAETLGLNLKNVDMTLYRAKKSAGIQPYVDQARSRLARKGLPKAARNIIQDLDGESSINRSNVSLAVLKGLNVLTDKVELIDKRNDLDNRREIAAEQINILMLFGKSPETNKPDAIKADYTIIDENKKDPE